PMAINATGSVRYTQLRLMTISTSTQSHRPRPRHFADETHRKSPTYRFELQGANSTGEQELSMLNHGSDPRYETDDRNGVDGRPFVRRRASGLFANCDT
ncbi:MAG: hypothetical protein ABJC63_05860, partial [Gemmatimonadales bacterium]